MLGMNGMHSLTRTHTHEAQTETYNNRDEFRNVQWTQTKQIFSEKKIKIFLTHNGNSINTAISTPARKTEQNHGSGCVIHMPILKLTNRAF